MNIVITGGAGYLGSNLTMRLLREGHRVAVVDNVLTGRLNNIREADKYNGLDGLEDGFRFIGRNVCDLSLLHDLKMFAREDGIQRIYHLASVASPIAYKAVPIATLRSGTQGTDNMLTIASIFGARFLFASTSEVYGQPLEHPQKESYRGNVDPVGVRSCYDESKRCGEAFTMAFNRAKVVDTRIVRIFNSFGEGLNLNDGRMIPEFCKSVIENKPIPVHGTGQQTRTLCYVSDTIDGIVRLMEYEGDNAHEPVNIGGTEEITVLGVAHTLTQIAGGDQPYPILIPQPCNDDPTRRKPDTTRARERLGWSQSVSLRDGLMRTLNWFRNGSPPIE